MPLISTATSLTDIWNNPVDAIGSVANYFKRMAGGQASRWLRPLLPLRTSARSGLSGPGPDLKPKFTVAEFAVAGVTQYDELDPQASAIAMKFELEDGYEYWLGLHNFYVITRYNHSAMYAMSVYQLSQRIAAGVAE